MIVPAEFKIREMFAGRAWQCFATGNIYRCDGKSWLDAYLESFKPSAVIFLSQDEYEHALAGIGDAWRNHAPAPISRILDLYTMRSAWR